MDDQLTQLAPGTDYATDPDKRGGDETVPAGTDYAVDEAKQADLKIGAELMQEQTLSEAEVDAAVAAGQQGAASEPPHADPVPAPIVPITADDDAAELPRPVPDAEADL